MVISPEDFKSDIAPDRVEGPEGEYIVENGVDGEEVRMQDYISHEAINRAGFSAVGQFLRHGNKLHIDAGGLLECAGRESLGAREAAREDLYGMAQVQDIVAASDKPHRGVYRVAGTFLQQFDSDGKPRRDFDPEFGKTCGFHHNFLIPRNITTGRDLELLVHVLGSHLSSRVWAWGGALREDGFVFSQKMWGIGGPVQMGYGNHRSDAGKKPMAAILTSDSGTVGDSSKWARFEDRSVDPSFSVEIAELIFATTSLALRLVEHADKLSTEKGSGRDRLLSALALKDQVKAARTFAGDLTMKKTAETASGDHVTALDLQERLAKFAIELSEKIVLPPDEERAAYEWLDRIRMLRDCSPDKGEYVVEAMRRTGFAPRHVSLLKKFEPHDLRSSNAPAAQRNLHWDEILPAGRGKRDPEGLGLRYWRGLYARLGLKWPGKPERPETKGGLREELMGRPDVTSAGWTSITIGDKNHQLKDPYQTELQDAA